MAALLNICRAAEFPEYTLDPSGGRVSNRLDALFSHRLSDEMEIRKSKEPSRLIPISLSRALK
jgi:hypothetical protein